MARLSTTRRTIGMFAAAAAFIGAVAAGASAFSLWPNDLPRQPSLYVIAGYLDQAPKGTKIVDNVQISANRRERTLLVTRYGYGTIPLDLYLSRSLAKPYWIRGSQENLERLASMPAGTRIEGTFAAYTDGPPWLLISELTFPADDEKTNPAS